MVMKDAIQNVIVDISLANVITCGQNLLQGPVNSQLRSIPSKVNPVVVAYKNEVCHFVLNVALYKRQI